MILRKMFFSCIVLAAAFSLAGCDSTDDPAQTGSDCAARAGSHVFRFSNADGAQQVPVVQNAGLIASGSLTMDTATGAASGSLEIRPLQTLVTLPVTTVTAVRVHEGARGANGDSVVSMVGSGNGVWRTPDGMALNPSQVSSFIGGNLYFNVITVAHPEGEIRGQIVTPPAADTLSPYVPADKQQRRPAFPDVSHVARIVIKFQEGTGIRLREGTLIPLFADRSAVTNGLQIPVPELCGELRTVEAHAQDLSLTLGPSILLDEARLLELKANGELLSGRQLADMNLFFGARITPGLTMAQLESFVAAMNALRSVEISYLEPIAAPLP